MAVHSILAVVPVTDFDLARTWYERLLGRPADSQPMPELADWQITDSGWLQVFRDVERAGTTQVNLAVHDLAEHLAAITERGLTPGEIDTASEFVRLCAIEDPDGNTITFVENRSAS